MTLKCKNCGSYALEITSQTYTDEAAFESYEAKLCVEETDDDGIGKALFHLPGVGA